MVLIIAEKPSLARNIVAGIGDMKKYNGYFIGNSNNTDFNSINNFLELKEIIKND